MILNSLSFSTDETILSASFQKWFALYSTNPISLINQSSFQGQATNHSIPVPNKTYVIMVGVKRQQKFTESSLVILDYQNEDVVIAVESSKPILNVLATSNFFAISCIDELKLYKYQPPGLVLQQNFHHNDSSPFDLYEIDDNSIRIAFCGSNKGELRIINYSNINDMISINAANHPLRIIKFSNTDSK